MRKYASALVTVGMLTLLAPYQLIADDQQPSVTELQNRVDKLSQIAGKVPTTEITCSVTDLKCTPAEIYISAASVSKITITTGITAPHQKLTVQVNAGEIRDTPVGRICVTKTFKGAPDDSGAPDKVVISIHKARSMSPTYANLPIAELLGTPKTGEKGEKRCSEQYGDDQNINFLTRGESPSLQILIRTDTEVKTIEVPIKYQRWFVDTGGILVFSTLNDQELIKKTDSGGKTTVTGTRKHDKLTPETGAVLDFYPANYPQWACQFGIVSNGDRQPSYFIGTGYRVRELGSKALATVSAGLIARQTLRFPDLVTSPTPPASNGDDPAQKGVSTYRLGGYIAFSFGFKFGDTEAAK